MIALPLNELIVIDTLNELTLCTKFNIIVKMTILLHHIITMKLIYCEFENSESIVE